MTGKYLLGAAALALMAATGAAQAADFTPVPVMVAPVVVAVPAGPSVYVNLEAVAHASVYFTGGGLDIWGNGLGEVKLQTGRWGFELLTNSYLNTGFFGSVSLNGRFYRAIGDSVRVGAFARSYINFPGGGLGPIAFGPTFAFAGDRITVLSDATFAAYNLFGELDTDTEVRFDVNERLKLLTSIQTDFNPGFARLDIASRATVNLTDRLELMGTFGVDLSTGGRSFDAQTSVRLALGSFTPYATTYWYSSGNFGGAVGVEFERQIGTGPFTLFADAHVDAYGNGNVYGLASIGIRFTRGEDDDRFVRVYEEPS